MVALVTPHLEPRRYTPGAGLLESGLLSDRGGRLAARRAFAELRLRFVQALEGLPGAAWLVNQVERAEEPVDLWLLRAPVFSALTGTAPELGVRGALLRRHIDSAFPDLDAGYRLPLL